MPSYSHVACTMAYSDLALRVPLSILIIMKLTSSVSSSTLVACTMANINLALRVPLSTIITLTHLMGVKFFPSGLRYCPHQLGPQSATSILV